MLIKYVYSAPAPGRRGGWRGGAGRSANPAATDRRPPARGAARSSARRPAPASTRIPRRNRRTSDWAWIPPRRRWGRSRNLLVRRSRS